MSNGTFPWESIFSIVSFLIGFIFGLIQLWQSQKYFLADQQSKFEKINDSVFQISQRLAVIEGVTNRLVEIDRTVRVIGATSGNLQTRLIDILARQVETRDQVAEATVETTDEITKLIERQFANSIDKESLIKFESKLDIILSGLSDQIVKLSQANIREVDEVQITPEAVSTSKLKIDPKVGIIYVDGKSVETLTGKEFELLTFLHKHAGEIVTIESIINHLYPGDESYNVNENAIAALVKRIRNKIESDPSHPNFLLNVRGLGYRLATNS